MATKPTKKPLVRQSKADKEKYGTLARPMKRKWIKALRSRRYKQVRSFLKRDGCFCCLGVLCDISKAGEWRESGGGVSTYAVKCVGELAVVESGHVPDPLRRAIGLSALTQGRLQRFNDFDGWGFRRIATWIEKHL